MSYLLTKIKLNQKSDVHDDIVSGPIKTLQIGCKFLKMTDIIQNEIPIDCKVIVFSEYVEVLKLCKNAIMSAISTGQMKERKVKTCIGRTEAKKRAKYFEMFGIKSRDEPQDAAKRGKRADKHAKVLSKFRSGSGHHKGTILLVLYVIGGIGLNLTGCHYGIFMEPMFNPQAEFQAANRMYVKNIFFLCISMRFVLNFAVLALLIIHTKFYVIPKASHWTGTCCEDLQVANGGYG